MSNSVDYMKEFISRQKVFEPDFSSFLCSTPEDIKKDMVDYLIWEISRKYDTRNEESALNRWEDFKSYLSKLINEDCDDEV